jgi:Carboxypeptidase regulatory-like domain/Tetratricopeptide repeat/TPR repeat
MSGCRNQIVDEKAYRTKSVPLSVALLLITASLACQAVSGAVRPSISGQEKQAAKPPFSLSISPELDVFMVGSPMPIRVVLKNTSSHSISLLELSWCNYTAEIRDSQGTLVKAKPLAEKRSDGTVLLRHAASSVARVRVDPGKTANNICTVYNLADDYEVTKPGKYSVQVLRYDDENKIWVKSNTISIIALPKRTGQVIVKVLDESGAVVPKATVEFERTWANVGYVCTDGMGRAVLNLEPATYTFWVSTPGFRTLKKRLEVSDGESQPVKLVLRAGGCPECPTVMGLAPVFQSTDNSLSVPDASNEHVRFEEAFQHYKHVVEVEPSNAGLHNSLGIAYAKSGQYEQARAEFKKAAELDPAGATHAYFNLGAIAFAPAFDAAIEDFTKAIDLDPANAEAYEWLGIALTRRANIVNGERLLAPPEAVRVLEMYLKLKPEGSYAQWDTQILKQGLPFNPPNPCAK